NPYTGAVQTNVMQALADPVTEKTLHMVTADPNRTPTFTLFADPDWFLFATGGPACAAPADCASIPARTNQSFAWNHGDIQDQIASWTLERNTLATAIKAQLEESAFYGQALDEQLAKSLTDQANQLIDKAVAGAAG